MLSKHSLRRINVSLNSELSTLSPFQLFKCDREEEFPYQVLSLIAQKTNVTLWFLFIMWTTLSSLLMCNCACLRSDLPVKRHTGAPQPARPVWRLSHLMISPLIQYIPSLWLFVVHRISDHDFSDSLSVVDRCASLLPLLCCVRWMENRFHVITTEGFFFFWPCCILIYLFY